MEEIRQQYPAVFEAMTRPGKHYVAMPGEEGARPFRARITAAWDDLVRSTSAGSIAVVTHRAVMMGLISTSWEFHPSSAARCASITDRSAGSM